MHKQIAPFLSHSLSMGKDQGGITLGALALAALLSACTVGPDYVRPETPAPVKFEQSKTGAYSENEPVAEFWHGFGDPVLSRLVDGALARNTDLRAGLARLDQARALARLSRRDLLPTVAISGGYTDARASADQLPPGTPRDSESHEAGIDVFWELDLFGRVRRGAEASRAGAEAVAADLRALQVSITAEVARTYFELRGLQQQLRVARGNADNQAATLRLTQLRFDAGRGTEFDVARARSQLEFTQSRVPALEAVVASAAHRLAVLNGLAPAALLVELEQPSSLPALPEAVAVGTPAELLRRRPDIQAVERRLASATARIGVATADLFPRVTLGGTYGSVATDLGDLFDAGTGAYAFGPGISWAFLDLGRVRDRIATTDAGARENLALYEGTVLRALEEAETALASYSHAQREGTHLDQSVSASDKAAELARLRFNAGATDFLQVLDAERSQLESQDRLAQNRTRTATALVAVYKAVAGGWPERVPGATVAARDAGATEAQLQP